MRTFLLLRSPPPFQGKHYHLRIIVLTILLSAYISCCSAQRALFSIGSNVPERASSPSSSSKHKNLKKKKTPFFGAAAAELLDGDEEEAGALSRF